MAGDGARLHACCARIELSIPGALTLKDRRAVIRSILERLKSRFNVSAADLDGGQRGAGRAAIGLAAAANERAHAHAEIDKAVEFIESDPRIETIGEEISDI